MTVSEIANDWSSAISNDDTPHETGLRLETRDVHLTIVKDLLSGEHIIQVML